MLNDTWITDISDGLIGVFVLTFLDYESNKYKSVTKRTHCEIIHSSDKE